MNEDKKIAFSLESVQFLLRGVHFFQENPQEQQWENLDRDLFLFLAQRLASLPQNDEENLSDYFLRLERYLSQIINGELTAPSLPQNLEEIVAAFDEFQEKQDADAPPPEEIKVPTIEKWIYQLKEKYAPAKETKTIIQPEFAHLEKQLKKIFTGTVSAPAETISKITRTAAKAVAVNSPSLTKEKINQLPPQQKAEIIKNIYNAALSSIAISLTKNNINLSGSQTAQLLNQLVLQTQDSVLALGTISPSSRLPYQPQPAPEERTAAPVLAKILHPYQTIATLFNRQEQRAIAALEKDPTLLYTITPTPEETPLGEKIRSVFVVQGINQQTVPLVQSLKQKTEGMAFAVRGISSDVLSQAVEKGRADRLPQEEIDQVTVLFNYQKDFEEKHPHLAQVFKKLHRNQEILSGIKNSQTLPASPYWPVESANQQLDQSKRWQFLRKANTFLSKTGLSHFSLLANRGWQKVKSWWQKTSLGKKIASRAQIGARKFFQKVLGQLGFLGKTGAKKGAIKIATWLSAKLAGTKLGAMLGSIVPGIGNVAGAIIGFAIDIGASLFKKGIGLFNNLLTKITGGQTEAEQKLKIALGPFSFLISPLVLILIIAIAAPVILTFLTITTTGGAFITPGAGGGAPIPTLPTLPPVPGNNLAEMVAQILYDCGYNSYINSTNINGVADCLNNSSLSSGQKQALITAFSNSINAWTSLQCVGFVRAIEASQGRTLPGCGESAKDWANPNCYTGQSHYQFLGKDCSQVNTGTIAVFTGGTDGHIGIITQRIESEEGGQTRFRFVSAIGAPGSVSGGRITVVEYFCDSFDAFIQPK